MKYLLFLLFSSATVFMVASDKQASGQNEDLTVPQLADSIRIVRSETLRIHAEAARNLDSVQQISEYLKTILLSHDYRVYKYSNPRLKLIYKWRKGMPGHWELIQKSITKN